MIQHFERVQNYENGQKRSKRVQNRKKKHPHPFKIVKNPKIPKSSKSGQKLFQAWPTLTNLDQIIQDKLNQINS